MTTVPRSALIAGALLVSLSEGGIAPSRSTPPPGGPLVVRDRLANDANDESMGELIERARYRWLADDIARTWRRVPAASGLTLQSDALDLLRLDDLYAIVANLAPSSAGLPVLLFWNDRAPFSPADYGRNRRDLRPRPDAPATVVLRRSELQGEGARPVRRLLLHFSEGIDARVVQRLAVVTTSDRFAGSSTGRIRVTVAGDTRDALFAVTPGRVSRPVNAVGGGELRFGLHAWGPAARAQVQLRLEGRGRSTTIFDGEVGGDSWRDFSVPLPFGGSGRVVLTATSASPTPVLWSNPMIVGPPEGSSRPNVILYVIDSLRPDRIGAYGATRGASPFIDALARQGVLFERAYAAAPWTKPAITTLLTSLYPQTHAVGARYYSEPLAGGVETLQSTAARYGYVTAQFSANPFSGTLSNLDRGFDQTLEGGAFQKGDSKIRSDALNARVLSWLRDHARDRFFVYIHSVDVHHPLDRVADGARGPRDPYDAALAFNDAQIARLYRALEETGAADNTLVVITADHGEAFGEHGQHGHGQSLYEEETRIPLIFHRPGKLRPERVAAAVHQADILPTILEHCGIAVSGSGFQGRSVARTRVENRPVFMSRFLYPQRLGAPAADAEAHAVVNFPWKLIVPDRRGAREPQLYNLASDPRERQNAASREPQHLARLEAALRGFLKDQAQARDAFVRRYRPAEGVSPLVDAGQARNLLEQLRTLGYVK